MDEVAPHLEDYGLYRVQISRQNREVEVTFRLQAGNVNVYAPHTPHPQEHKTHGLSLVVATEVACRDCKTQGVGGCSLLPVRVGV